MYQYQSAAGKSLAMRGRWVEIDIRNTPLNTIYNNYYAVQVVLTNTYLQKPVMLDLMLMINELRQETMTFNEWLVSISNRALTTSDKTPTYKSSYVRFKDAFQAQYTITPVKPGLAPDVDVPPSERTWLHLTRPNTDMEHFRDYCMVSVNGFWHYVDTAADGAWVMEGNVSRNRCKHNQVGILNFQDVTKIRHKRITEDMLFHVAPGEGFGNRVGIRMGEDITNKTLGIVIGGYLHLLDPQVLYAMSADTVCVDFRQIPMMERYHESFEYIDLERLQVEHRADNPMGISIASLQSDEVMRRYMTLPQTFLVLLDHPDMYVAREPVHFTNMPSMLVSYMKPNLPLMLGYGRIAEYWAREDCGQWSLTVQDSTRDNYQHQTTGGSALPAKNDSQIPGRYTSNYGGYMLKICADS